jgi:hypothetical protein
MANELQPNERLVPGLALSSGNREYSLILQGDGNLVLYHVRDKRVLWASNTQGKNGTSLVMQLDGNLVLYNNQNTVVWASNTAGKPFSYLLVQDDGNMVIYQPTSIWSTNTAQ